MTTPSAKFRHEDGTSCHFDECSDCRGSGKAYGGAECKTCHGSGG